MRGLNIDRLHDVVFDVATRANDQLITSRSFKSVPPDAIPCLLNSIETEYYLQQLQKKNFDLFDGGLNLKSLTVPFRLFVNFYRNKY